MLSVDFTGVYPRDNFAHGIFKDKANVKEKEGKKEERFCI